MPGGDLSRKGGSVAGQGHDGDGFERYRPLLREEVRASEAAYRAQLTAAKFARTAREHRQGAPDLALEVEHAADQIVKERADRLVDVRGLAAGVAVAADQQVATIEAGTFVGVAGALAMR